MRRGLYVIFLALIVLILSAAFQTPKKAAYVEGQVLIKFTPAISAEAVNSALAAVGAQTIAEVKPIGMRKLKLGTGVTVQDAVKKLREMSNVAYAEPNYIYHTFVQPNDPNYSKLWGMENTGQTGGLAGADIKATAAWDITMGSSNVVVGIIDTGIDYKHEDLAANIYTNAGEDAWVIPNDPTSGNGSDDDGNGKIDDYKGWNFITNKNDPYDDNMHGTHVAGTIGAIGNNGKGVVGVNWQVKMMPLKFLDGNGSGTTDKAIDAIIYATDMGVKILSNSWGGDGFSQALEDAISYANDHGVLFVAAAGNDGVNTDDTPNYPSCYNLANILAVAASDHGDTRALWGGGGGEDDCGFLCNSVMAVTPGSNYGKVTVDLAAPGKDIYSTVPGGYQSLSGTSMATPHVAGAAALLLAKNSGLTHLQVKDRLMNSVDKVAAFKDIVASDGRMNVAAALQGL